MGPPPFEATRDFLSQGVIAAIVIGTFALLASDRVHRVLVPLGGTALIWTVSYLTPIRLISFEASKDAVDLNVILLLFSMMALVGVLKTTNVFAWAADQLLARSRGNPYLAAMLITWFTAILSALLDNVTTVIFAFPMVLAMARQLRINPSALLLPMVMAANIGGTATLIGDPPNLLIGASPRAGLSFSDFILNLAVPSSIMLMTMSWFSRRYYPEDIGRAADRDHPSIVDASGAQLENVPLLKATGTLSAMMMLGFLTHSLTHMPVAVPAVIGIAAILFVQDYFYLKHHRPTFEERRHGVLQIIEKDVEWPTLVFFLFLFVVVGASVQTGLIDTIAQALGTAIASTSGALALSQKATLLLAALMILWTAGILSAIVDNVPFTAVSIPLVATLGERLAGGGDGQILWWALALGACLGGNGTIFGASANITVMGLAEKEGRQITFREFFAFGARVTAFTLVISSIYLALWLYLGSVLVNAVGAGVVAMTLLVRWFGRDQPGGRSNKDVVIFAAVTIGVGLVALAVLHSGKLTGLK